MRGATLRDRPRRGVHHGRRGVRRLRPRGRDLVVEGREVGDRLPPRAEQRPAVGLGALGGRLAGSEDRAVVDRQSRGRRGLREADAAAAEHRLRAMRNISARPAERDPQLRAGGIVERLFKLHDRHRRLVLEEMAAVGPPGRLLVGVDHVRHRPDRHGGRGTIFLRSVGPRPGHCLLRLRKVGGGVDELDLLPILRVGLLHLNLQPTDRPQAVATRAVHEQVAVGESLELQASGPREVGRGLEDVLGVAVADHQDRAVGPLRGMGEQAGAVHLFHRDGRPRQHLRRRVGSPGVDLGLPLRPHPPDLLLRGGDVGPDRGEGLQLLGGVDVRPGLVGVVQEGEQAVVFVVRDRIELVGVALGALRGEAEHRLAHAVDTIEHLRHPELLRNDRALLVEHAVAEEAGGHDLILRRIRQQIACDLLDHELVVGQIAAEGVDHPVAPGPHLARQVFLVAVGVGVAGEVEPVAGPLLAIAGAREQCFDGLVVAVALEGGELVG